MEIGELRELARRGDAGAAELGQALERVPGLTCAVLEIANRSAGVTSARFRSVDRAVIVLGARAVVEIALAVLPSHSAPPAA